MDALPFCASQLNAALLRDSDETPHSCCFRRCSCGELARLQHDSMAQVLSFYPVSFIPTLPGRFAHTIRHHTLAAVSPHTRLYAEALVLRSCTDTGFEGAQVSEHQLMYWILLHGRAPSLPRLELTLWWAERCGLPIVLTAPNACRRLLTMLSARWRQQVWWLRLVMRPTQISDSVEVAEGENEGGEASDGSAGTRWTGLGRRLSMPAQLSTNSVSPVRLSSSTFLNALPSFAQLKKLFIAGEYAANPSRAAAAVAAALRVVKSMSVTEVELRLCKELTSVSELAGAPCLERLIVCRCGITDLRDLVSCPRLSVVDVSHNEHLTDLSGLAGAPVLRELVASDCAVSCIDDLNRCPLLKRVTLSENLSLTCLHGLAGAPSLQTLELARTAVADLGALHSCSRLMSVDVRGCRRVRGVASLMQRLDVLSDVVT
jgi:hypothetical protein